MAKIVRLTESDLVRLVKKVIKEQDVESAKFSEKADEETLKNVKLLIDRDLQPQMDFFKRTGRPFMKDIGGIAKFFTYEGNIADKEFLPNGIDHVKMTFEFNLMNTTAVSEIMLGNKKFKKIVTRPEILQSENIWDSPVSELLRNISSIWGATIQMKDTNKIISYINELGWR